MGNIIKNTKSELINFGIIDVNINDYKDSKNYYDQLEFLLKNGVDLFKRDKYGYDILFYFCKNPDTYNTFKILNLFILFGGKNIVNNKYDNGRNLLFYRIDNRIKQYLINNGTNVNSINYHGNTPLFDTIYDGDIEFLINNGADLNITNNEGNKVVDENVTVLDYITRHRNKDINIYNSKNESILFYFESIRYLITDTDIDYYTNLCNIDINKQNIDGETALFKYIRDNYYEYVFRLLINKADANIKNNDGLSSLHFANDCRMMSLLLKYGDVDIKDNDGNSLLYHYINNVDIFKLLIDNDINVNSVNNNGKLFLEDLFSGNVNYKRSVYYKTFEYNFNIFANNLVHYILKNSYVEITEELINIYKNEKTMFNEKIYNQLLSLTHFSKTKSAAKLVN